MRSSASSYYDTEGKVIRMVYAPGETGLWGLIRPSYEVEIPDGICRLRRDMFGENYVEQPTIHTVGVWDMVRLKRKE